MQDGCLWRTWQFENHSCIISILLCFFLSPSSSCLLIHLFLLTIFVFPPHLLPFFFLTFVLQSPVSCSQNFLLSSLGPAYNHTFISPLSSECQSTNKSHPDFSNPLFSLFLFSAITAWKQTALPLCLKNSVCVRHLGNTAVLFYVPGPSKLKNDETTCNS